MTGWQVGNVPFDPFERTWNGQLSVWALSPRPLPFLLRQPELPIDGDPSAGYLFLADSQGPHRQAVFVNGAARCFVDRHEVVECSENAD
jgi:hypothetical protein